MMQPTHHPTPDISHLKSQDFQQVYEPAEDSFLLLDALEQEFQFLNDLKPVVCVEVGCGSGVCLTFLSQILKLKSLCIATDINVSATEVCYRTAKQNGVHIEPLLCNLVSGIVDRLDHQVDILLFNPPYVVTPSSEVGSTDIVASWAGGVKGREVIDRLLPSVDRLLSDNGVFYLVVIKENNQEEMKDILGREMFICESVLSRKSGPEHLSILKFTRLKHGN